MTSSKNSEKEMSFLDHLEELRWHLIRSVIAILLVAIVAFIFISTIVDAVLMAPTRSDFITYGWLCQLSHIVSVPSLCLEELELKELKNIVVSGQFTWAIWISVISGLVVAFPYVVWEFWRFISPGLHMNERRNASGAVFFITLLFLSGVAFAYFLILPLTIHFFSSFSISDQITNEWLFTSYLSVSTSLILGCGIVFELPMFIYFLAKVRLVSSKFLRRYRKHALVIILIISAVITPPDVASQILVSLPLAVLYELGVAIARRVEKRYEKQELAERKQ